MIRHLPPSPPTHPRPTREYLHGVEDVEAVGHRLPLQLIGLAVLVPAGPQLLERLGVEHPPREGRRTVRAPQGAGRLALLPADLVLLVPEELALHLVHQPALPRQLIEAGASEHEAAAGGQELWVNCRGVGTFDRGPSKPQTPPVLAYLRTYLEERAEGGRDEARLHKVQHLLGIEPLEREL